MEEKEITTTEEALQKATDKKAEVKSEEKTLAVVDEIKKAMQELTAAIQARPAETKQDIPELIKQMSKPNIQVKDVKHKLGMTAIIMANAHYNLDVRKKLSETPFEDGLKEYGIDPVSMYPENTIKNLNGSIFTDGGVFIPEIWNSEIIPLLNAATVIRQSGARVMDMPSGNMNVSKALTGATAYWRGETGNKTTSSSTFGSVSLSEKTLYVDVPVSDKLLRNAQANTAKLIEDIIQIALSSGEDTGFLLGTGSVYQPNGLHNQISSTNDVAMTGGSSTTAATRKTDLMNAVKALTVANVKMVNPCWFFNPKVEINLKSQVDSNSNAMDYAKEMKDNKTLMGFPFFATTMIPFVATCNVYLIDMSYVVIGQGEKPSLQFIKGGAYWDGSVTVVGQQTGESVFTAQEGVDIALTQSLAGAKITGVTWGV